jgi:hypothetical protein
MVDTAFYNEMAQVTLALITDKGRDDLVLTRFIEGEYDPDTDTELPGHTDEQPMSCVVLPVGASPADGLIDGTAIAAGTRNVKIAAKGLLWAPEAGDYIKIPEEGGDIVRWVGVGVTPISPAGIPLLYTMMVTRG